MSRYYVKVNNGVHKTRTMRGFESRGMDIQVLGLKSVAEIRIDRGIFKLFYKGQEVARIYNNSVYAVLPDDTERLVFDASL